jgi:hypothetical protein
MDNEHLIIIALLSIIIYCKYSKCSSCGGSKYVDKKKEGYDFYGRRENPLYRDA